MVQIKKMLVPSSRAVRVRFSGTNPKEYITVHQTGNTSRGADAYMHAKLQYNGNVRQASWHYTIDSKGVAYQSFSHDDKLFHAGDGPNGRGNGKGIAVEICVNSDGDYSESVKNGVELVKWIMEEEGISAVKVINHNEASGKWCPSQILGGKEGLTWSWFKKALDGATGSVSQGESEKAPSNKPAYNGSIVDYLNQQGIKSNINNRKNLAVEYDIVNKESDYTGMAKQNTDLLNAMLKGEPKQEGTRKEPIQSGYTGNSIVDYLVSIKKDASFESRKELASQNGIRGYVGTAKQNRELLNKLRGGGGSSPTKATKSVDTLAKEVIDGKYGSGEARKRALGNRYNEVQKRVNQMLNARGRTTKSLDQLAREVIDGKWGNNPERSRKLRQAGYDANAVQRRVNQLL